MRGCRLLVALFLVAGTGGTSAFASDYEVWYRLSARVRSVRADADLEAGGRLAMAAEPATGDGLALSLREVRESPWKLFWVDPLGPLGEEVKVGSVITLPDASWEALESQRSAARAEARRRHVEWLEHADRPRDLDGSFAFVVIGHPRDRFTVEIGGDGPVESISNAMTARWLPGPFDQFVGSWGTTPRAAQSLQGYWFWNDGDTAPPGFEPRTYRGFRAALELLPLPLTAAAEAKSDFVDWPEEEASAIGVLRTLAPQATFPEPNTRGSTRHLRLRSSGTANGGLRLEVSPQGPGAGPDVERETVFSSAGRPVSDRIRVRVKAGRRAVLVVEAGYQEAGTTEESR